MSEVQRPHDARAILRFLLNILRLEMHQLRRDHRSHDFKQSAEEFGCSQAAGSGDSLESLQFVRIQVGRFDRHGGSTFRTEASSLVP
jgi:hypothetical protein